MTNNDETQPEEAAADREHPGDSDAWSSAGDLVARRAEGGGMGQLASSQFSLASAIGGWRGLVESVLPAVVFVVVFLLTRDLAPPLITSLAVAGLLVVARLISRTPLTQALGGVIGVAIGAVWAWRSGQAQDYFVFGLWTNAAYALALLVSILLRYPAVGIIVALLRGEGMAWRNEEPPRHWLRRYTMATWLWFALFALRLAVQVPLYLQAAQDWSATAWLGTARLVMGVPLWALALWLTWVLVRRPPRPAPGHEPEHS